MASPEPKVEVVAIGSSAGGPSALRAVLGGLPAALPVAILVVQHLPKGFSAHISRRLARDCALQVIEAQDGSLVGPGRVFVAPSGAHMVVRRESGRTLIRLVDDPDHDSPHCPAADVLLRSVAEVYGSRALGIVLTGMGNDGTAGLGAIRSAGGRTWAQDEASSTIYGMPRAAAEAGVVDRVLSLQAIGPEILRVV